MTKPLHQELEDILDAASEANWESTKELIGSLVLNNAANIVERLRRTKDIDMTRIPVGMAQGEPGQLHVFGLNADTHTHWNGPYALTEYCEWLERTNWAVLSITYNPDKKGYIILARATEAK